MQKMYFEVLEGKTIGFFPKLSDGKYSITEVMQIRSLDQNRMYFWYIIKYITLAYEEKWYIHSKSHIHKSFKRAFLEKEKVYSDWKSDEYVMKIWSTTKLNTKQFSEFIWKIKIFCEHGVLWEVEWLEYLEPFVIPDISEDELLGWIDKVC